MTNTMKLLALALVTLLQGCALTELQRLPASGGVVCIDSNMTDTQIDAVSEAVTMWAEASGGRVTLFGVVTDDDTQDVCDASVRSGDPDALAMTYARTLKEPRIRIDWARLDVLGKDYAVQVQVVAHELGHAMGAEHTDDSSRIMHNSTLPTRKITSADIDAVLDAQ